MTQGTAAPNVRLVGLDVVRGLAAFSVVLSHVALVSEHASAGARWTVSVLQSNLGAWGVGLFFVLSGLCIHLPLARRWQLDPAISLAVRPYAFRRFVRIYPPHLVALLLSAALALTLPAAVLAPTPLTKPTTLQFVLHLFMVHSFVLGAASSINSTLWTIAVETHFYLLYPLLLPAAKRYGFVRVTVALFALSLLARGVGLAVSESLSTILEGNFICRFWEWTLGCCIAERIAARRVVVPTRALHFWLLGAASLLFALLLKTALRKVLGVEPGRRAGNELTALFAPLAYAVVIHAACGLPASWRRGAGRALDQLGIESYSLYLSHPITLGLWWFALSFVHVELPMPLLSVGCIVVCLLAAHGFFLLFERPSMRRAVKCHPVQYTQPVPVATE